MPHLPPDFETFERLASTATSDRPVLVPLCRRVLADQLTPVLAYRRWRVSRP